MAGQWGGSCLGPRLLLSPLLLTCLSALALPPSEQVREYEASAELFAESRAKRSELQEAVKEYDGELKALRQEMDMQVGECRSSCAVLYWRVRGGVHQ